MSAVRILLIGRDDLASALRAALEATRSMSVELQHARDLATALADSEEWDALLLEVLRRYPPGPEAVPLSRCLVCGGPLRRVDRAAVEDEVPPASRAAFDAYSRCGGCRRVYWKGSHHDRLVELVAELEHELRCQP